MIRKSIAVFAGALLAVPSAAWGLDASPDRGRAVGCGRTFDEAVAAYVRATDDKDLAAMERLLHPDNTIVLPSGGTYAGKPQSMEFFEEFFGDPSWSQTFTQVRRAVSGCDTGFVLMDSVYSQTDGYRTHLLIGLTFTHRNGAWQVILDQNTRFPA